MRRLLVLLLLALFAGLLITGRLPVRKEPLPQEYAQVNPVSEEVLHRRKTFCAMVESAKASRIQTMDQAGINSFNLSPSTAKWESIREEMQRLGCPTDSLLLESLGIESMPDVEFGSAEGDLPCRIPEPCRSTLDR